MGLALPSWGRGWPYLLWVGVVQLCVVFITKFNYNHTMIIISEGGGRQDRDWPLGFGSAIGLGLALPSSGFEFNEKMRKMKKVKKWKNGRKW